MENRIKRRRVFKHFPDEIAERILYELKVKSLLRFKCVSKSWRCLISSSDFVKEHLKKSNSTGTDFAHHNLLFLFSPSNRVSSGSDYLPVERFIKSQSVGSFCVGSFLSDNDDVDYEPNLSLPSNQSIPSPASVDAGSTCLLGSCNGLVLIGINQKELYLWNPSTRKAKNIINASFPQETAVWKNRSYFLGCGLGYNELTDDYKVVSTFCSHGSFMYSSRTDSWKKIQNFNHKPFHSHAMFVNGRLHWLRHEEKDNAYLFVVTIPLNIISLDLVEEKQQIMAPPPHCSYCHPFLAELGGYLSLIGRAGGTMDVWIMKKESWSKIWTFLEQYVFSLNPIWLKKNGDIVATRSGSDVVVYRGQDKLRQSRIGNMMQSTKASIVYVESLVAPISDDNRLRR